MIGNIITGIVIFLTVVLIGWIISVYNNIKRAEQDYKGMWADIKVEYQKRFDMLNNIVESLKSYVKFEKGTMEKISEMRSGVNKMTPKQVGKVESMFAGLNVQMEAYPDLKANEQYKEFTTNVKECEILISEARGELNNIVEDFNTYISLFPTNFIAKGMFNAKPMEYYEVPKKKELGSTYKARF